MRNDLPAYGGDNTTLKPGLYLGLFHGRKTPTEELDDWGFGGPVIGPLEYVHTTYAAEVKIKFENPADFRRYFPGEKKVNGFSAGPNYIRELAPHITDDLMKPEVRDPLIAAGVIKEVYEQDETQLSIHEDMLVFEGEFYGDWTVFVVGNVLPTTKQIAKELS